jgi:hypothetical protein
MGDVRRVAVRIHLDGVRPQEQPRICIDGQKIEVNWFTRDRIGKLFAELPSPPQPPDPPLSHFSLELCLLSRDTHTCNKDGHTEREKQSATHTGAHILDAAIETRAHTHGSDHSATSACVPVTVPMHVRLSVRG